MHYTPPPVIPGTLAVTGLGFNLAWYLVAAATLLFFGSAVVRLIPRKES